MTTTPEVMKPETAAGTEVAVKPAAGVPAVMDFAADAGAGFEDASSNCYAIPFLRMLQSISPQAKKKDPAYIDGAEEGDFVNTVTGKLYKGDKGVFVIPVHFMQKYTLWAQNRGGFRGFWTPAEYATKPHQMITISTGGGPKDVEADMDGNVITDTREHYVVIVNEDGTTEAAVLSLSSTQLKKSKKWMSLMNGIRINGQIAPMFSQMYKITPVAESNDQGSWSGINIELVKQLDNADMDFYMAAKLFREMVRSGAAAATHPDDEIPF